MVNDLRDRARRARWSVGRHAPRSPATCSPSAACATCAGPNYRGRAGPDRGHARAARRWPRCARRSASTACSRTPMTEAAIDTGFTRDLYVSLGEPVGRQRLDRARVRQALRRLDLGRLPADGAGRPAAATDRRYRAQRSARARRARAPSALTPARAARHEEPALPHSAGAVPGAGGLSRRRPQARTRAKCRRR